MSGSEQGSVADSRADGPGSSGSTRAPSSASGSRASRRLPQRSEPWPKDGWRVRTWIMFCGLLQVTCQTKRHSHWRATACCACATRRTLSLSRMCAAGFRRFLYSIQRSLFPGQSMLWSRRVQHLSSSLLRLGSLVSQS